MNCFLRNTPTHNRWRVALMLLVAVAIFAPTRAQAQVSSGRLRPFVMGIIPVVGSRGQVGGVLVDAKGSISVRPQASKELQMLRQKSLKPQSEELRSPSKLRKVSLRGLQLEILKRIDERKALGDDIQFLAGLQRIEYVFADPTGRDIVLAGPAEGWRVDEHGEFVGVGSGTPVLQIDDLVVALRGVKDVHTDAISCSIDPSQEGLQKLLGALRSGSRQPSVRQLQVLLGPQTITVKGVPATSHFARVLVAADVRMKRLAMNLERSPVPGLPSYLQLLRNDAGKVGQAVTPRWWLAPNYKPLERDPLGLAWRLSGPGLKALTQDEQLGPAGQRRQVGSHPAAQQWAEKFTERLPQISRQLKVFAKLRGCVDLAMAAGIIDLFELEEQAECDLSLLVQPKPLKVASYGAAQRVPSQASFVQARRGRIVALSGGVEVKPLEAFGKVREVKQLGPLRSRHLQKRQSWWWD